MPGFLPALSAALVACTQAAQGPFGPAGSDRPDSDGDTGRIDSGPADSSGGADTSDSGRPDLGTLEIHMLDVWQGDAILVVAPSGQTMLVDAGEESDYWGLREHLRETGYGIDYTVVSHQHADHMGAMDWVLQDHPEVIAAYDGGGSGTSNAYIDYDRWAGDKRTTIARNDTLDLGENLIVDVVHADIGDDENENNNSVVLRLTHGEITVLLGGDCESWVCERSFRPGEIDVYKVHHHGSSDSSSWRMLEEMSPSIALIGVGVGNDYGHPEQVTLDSLADIGAAVYRTDLHGNIVVRSDGRALEVETGVR